MHYNQEDYFTEQGGETWKSYSGYSQMWRVNKMPKLEMQILINSPVDFNKYSLLHFFLHLHSIFFKDSYFPSINKLI